MIQRLSTWGGDYRTDSSESEITDGNFYGFTVLEDDTVVSKSTGGENGQIPSPAIDYKAYNNIASKQLPKGSLWVVPMGEVIKNFKLSAGAVILHRIARP